MSKVALTNTYQRYPEYKDSGVEWIGDIPENWRLEKVKYAAPLYSKKVSGKNNLGTYVALENVQSWTGRHLPHADLVEPESIVNVFEETDILFGKLRPYLAKVFQPNFDGTATGEFLVLRPTKKICKKYLFYRLISPEFINTVNDSTYGSQMPRANWSFIGNLQVTIPDQTEQEKIARFLDKQTERIDSIIAKKQRLIELLKEKRTATINHAVTKGLDPKAELLDSGIDWLGMIDSSFEVIKLRYLVKVSTGSKDTANADPGGNYPFFVRSPIIERINSYSFNGEAVLTAGDGAGVGKVFHYFNGKLDYHQRVYLFSNFKKVTGKYFYYYLSSNLARVVLMGESKSTVDSIRMPQLLKMPFTIPGKEDQAKIVGYLDEQTKKYDEVLEKVKLSIDKLIELKHSLTSHAVTGKIKV